MDDSAGRVVNSAAEAGYVATIATEREQALKTVTLAWLTRRQICYTAITVTGPGGKIGCCPGHGHDRPAILVDDDPAKERPVRPGVQVDTAARMGARCIGTGERVAFRDMEARCRKT